MKVKDLIEKLASLDPEIPVLSDVHSVGMFDATVVEVIKVEGSEGEYTQADSGGESAVIVY